MGMAIRPSEQACGATVTGVDLTKELAQCPVTDICQEWSSNMLVMWDNRSVLHQATGGYGGYDRLLHRTTTGSLS